MSSQPAKKAKKEAPGLLKEYRLKGLKKINLDRKEALKRNKAKKEEPQVQEPQEKEEDEIDLEGEDVLQDDPFMLHFQNELSPSLINCISSKPPALSTSKLLWPSLGSLIVHQPNSEDSQRIKTTVLDKEVYSLPQPFPSLEGEFGLEKLFIKSQILDNVKKSNERFNSEEFSDLQKELLTIAFHYHDIYFTERTFDNGEEIRFIYCVHAINHVLKTRLKVIRHNAKLLKKKEVPEEFRDQGLVRPKVIIVVPFKDAALRVVKMIIAILLGESGNVMNKQRFMDEYKGETEMKSKTPKPDDYKLLFSGNIDDNFKIGLSVTKKCLKLYSDFYSADIILASPLGLRTIIGAEGESERDYDFLTSVEVLIMDQAHVFSMQNWEHVLHVFDHLHLQPRENHGTDLSRVRMWTLNGHSKYFRQNMIFTSHPLPEITSLYYSKCYNYNGRVSIVNPIQSGSIRQVIPQMPQLFQYLSASSVADAVDSRFNMFTTKVLPKFQDPTMKHTLVYVPSYFDFVRLRNYFKLQGISFVQICEYTKEGKVARARDLFFHGEAHFMLYSERFHFFRRIHLRGIRHIVFYQPPSIPNFYSEMCNFLIDIKKNNIDDSLAELSSTLIYSKFDVVQLASIVGTERATRMIASDNEVHMFMTDDG